MEHAKTINDLMPCDSKRPDFLAVWVEPLAGGEVYRVVSQGDRLIVRGHIGDPARHIAALEAMEEQDRPYYLVGVAS